MCYSVLVEQDLKKLIPNFDSDISMVGIEEFKQSCQTEPNLFKEISDSRIYPFYFINLLYQGKNGFSATPMRYQLWPSSYAKDPKHLSLFNARVENLNSPIWGRLFLRRHAILPIKSFYEWVAVKDLLQAGVVNLEEVDEVFAKQSQNRKERIVKSGKTYKPTATELKRALDRKIVISFSAMEYKTLYVPVLFDYFKTNAGNQLGSFAIITGEPTAEILAAGHDRRPVFFDQPEQALAFLNPQKTGEREISELLNQAAPAQFVHRLDVG